LKTKRHCKEHVEVGSKRNRETGSFGRIQNKSGAIIMWKMVVKDVGWGNKVERKRGGER